MGRSRYIITEPNQPHFLTCTVMEWLPLFSRPALVEIVLDCWRDTSRNTRACSPMARGDGESPALSGPVPEPAALPGRFKSFTARKVIEHLQRNGAERALERLRSSKRTHKHDRQYQFWQEGSHAERVCSEAVMEALLHPSQPMRRGYVDRPEHWRYSSARNYAGETGLLEVARWG